MSDLIKFLKGKKTFLIAIAVVVLGCLQGFDVFTLPEYIWPILGGLGLASVRDGINTWAAKIKGDGDG